MHKIIALVAVPAALSVALTAPAMAARTSSATLTVTTTGQGVAATSQPTVGSSLAFSGCGYTPDSGVNVKVVGPTASTFIGEWTGSDGCFSTADTVSFPANVAGTYAASAYQSSRRKADATVTFTVSE
jgi:hypothetical protein